MTIWKKKTKQTPINNVELFILFFIAIEDNKHVLPTQTFTFIVVYTINYLVAVLVQMIAQY